MKIDSTDASSIVLTKTSDIGEGTRAIKQGPRPADAVSRNRVIEMKNISQISDCERAELPVSEKVVIDAIERANKAIMGANRKFEFAIHEKTKEIMIKVVNSETNEVIREIPPEKILDMVAKMWEMAGLVVDERR